MIYCRSYRFLIQKISIPQKEKDMYENIRKFAKFAIWMTIIVISLRSFSEKFALWLIRFEILMAFLTICSENFPKRLDGTRPYPKSPKTLLKRGIAWPKTIGSWAFNARVEEILHFGGYLWAVLITSWHWRTLWFTVDRQHFRYGDQAYLITLYGVMFFLTLCLGMFPLMRAQFRGMKYRLSEKQRIFIRALFWWITIPRWFISGDWRILGYYITALWLVVPIGWLFTDFNEALDQIGGAFGRVF
jgi:hypothetical protein